MDNEQVLEFLYQLENNIERAESDTWTVLSLDVAQGTTLRAMLRNALADSEELARLRAEIAGAPVVKVRHAGATFGHGDSGNYWVIGDSYNPPPKSVALGVEYALLRLPAGEGE